MRLVQASSYRGGLLQVQQDTKGPWPNPGSETKILHNILRVPRQQLREAKWLLLPSCRRYANEPREALKEFNFARKNTMWGAQAILHMVEVS